MLLFEIWYDWLQGYLIKLSKVTTVIKKKKKKLAQDEKQIIFACDDLFGLWKQSHLKISIAAF